MNKRFLAILAALLIPFLGNLNLLSAETKPDAPTATTPPPTASHMAVVKDLNDLIGRIKEKIAQRKQDEADYADNFKELDALLVKHKNADADDRAEILMQKGIIYLEVLEDPVKALPVFQQIKTDFPSIQLNGNTDEFLAGVKEMADKKKIRDALVGVPFPDFNEKDIQGDELSISKYKGKVVLLDFWATWCPPCVREVPDIQKLYNKYHSQGFEIVGISLDEEKDALENFVKQRKMPWPQIFAGNRFENKLAIKYGIAFAPSTFLIGRDGKVVKQVMGTEELDKELQSALKK